MSRLVMVSVTFEFPASFGDKADGKLIEFMMNEGSHCLGNELEALLDATRHVRTKHGIEEDYPCVCWCGEGKYLRELTPEDREQWALDSSAIKVLEERMDGGGGDRQHLFPGWAYQRRLADKAKARGDALASVVREAWNELEGGVSTRTACTRLQAALNAYEEAPDAVD